MKQVNIYDHIYFMYIIYLTKDHIASHPTLFKLIKGFILWFLGGITVLNNICDWVWEGPWFTHPDCQFW